MRIKTTTSDCILKLSVRLGSPGASCSKLTTSLVNVSLNFQT